MANGGNIIRISPAVSTSAYDAGDVLFQTVEVPNVVSERGGVSRLISVVANSYHDATDDIELLFMQNSKDLITSISPGSSGGPVMTDTAAREANFLGTILLDGSIFSADWGGGRLYTNRSSSNSYPILLKPAEGSKSVYVTGIANDAQTYSGVKDLDLIFHVEYL